MSSIVQKIYILFFISITSIYAQSRNNQVRLLNSIVDYMDESSRIDQYLYLDIKQFAEGYIHSTSPKKNNNYWYTLSSSTTKIGYFDGAERFPEMHVDNEKMVIDFEYALYPYLQARESMDKLLTTNFFNDKENIKRAFMGYKLTMDSLIILHRILYNYVTDKSYLSDADFKTALNIIDNTSHILDNYHANSAALYLQIAQYYLNFLPPVQTQQKIIYAETEMHNIINLMNGWETKLFEKDSSYTTKFDLLLHKYNDEGLSKDSLFFYGTYGYKVQRNGAMPHTRYCIFYSMMQHTLYWYAKDKYYYPTYMKRSDTHYNQFVDRTHMVIEDYNDLIECADGKRLSENLDYSMKMAAQIGLDTNQNVLLKNPRWGYIFHFVKPGEKLTITDEKNDTTVSIHQQMINQSLPHHMIFLLDISASMHDPGKLDLLKIGTKYLVDLQRRSDHISLLTFSTHSHILLRNIPCDQRGIINAKIDELHTHGATNASEGIHHAFDIADSNQIVDGKNKIILVTDGKFQLDVSTSKLLSEFKNKNIELIIFLIGSKEDPSIDKEFKKMSKKGNGKYYKVDEKNLEEVLITEASD